MLNPTILIASEYQDLSKNLVPKFEKRGFNVEIATSVSDALQLAKSLDVRFIIGAGNFKGGGAFALSNQLKVCNPDFHVTIVHDPDQSEMVPSHRQLKNRAQVYLQVCNDKAVLADSIIESLEQFPRFLAPHAESISEIRKEVLGRYWYLRSPHFLVTVFTAICVALWLYDFIRNKI